MIAYIEFTNFWFAKPYKWKFKRVQSFQLEGDELVGGDLRVPAIHNARNIGPTRFREILVETK